MRVSYYWGSKGVFCPRKIFKIVLCDRLTGLHSSLDLALFLDPNDESSRFLLARIQVHLGIDLEEVLSCFFFICFFPAT